MAHFDDAKKRDEYLNAVLKLGDFKSAQIACGISRPTYTRYAQKNHEFKVLCEKAKTLYKWNQHVKYVLNLQQKAVEKLNEKLDNDELSENTLIKLAYEPIPAFDRET